ncbi:MAG: hypothetical protein ACT4PJ_13920 [Gemmatimonadaceae bacterium]
MSKPEARGTRHVSQAEVLGRINLLIDFECDGLSAVLASRAGLEPEVAAQLQNGDERALTGQRLLAILHAFPRHAHWLISGEGERG